MGTMLAFPGWVSPLGESNGPAPRGLTHISCSSILPSAAQVHRQAGLGVYGLARAQVWVCPSLLLAHLWPQALLCRLFLDESAAGEQGLALTAPPTPSFGSLGFSFPLRQCFLPADLGIPWGKFRPRGARTEGAVYLGPGRKLHLGVALLGAQCLAWAHRAHLGLLMLALGLLPHLFQLLHGPGELLPQQPSLCFFQ